MAVKIAGAGPAGVTAAINLAKAGFSVHVYEKNKTVGKRFHGDYQGIESWLFNKPALKHLAEMNINTDYPLQPVDEGIALGPDGKEHTIKSKEPFFYLVTRGSEEGSLDTALLKQAQESGVQVHFSSAEDVVTDCDIVATGFAPDGVTDTIAVGYIFETGAPDQYWAIIDDSVAPDGYAYCLILNGRATLAVCQFKDFKRSREYLDKVYKIFKDKIGFEDVNRKKFSGIANGFWPKKVEINEQLYVGEAGGFIDGFLGFGIRYAMYTGYLAAQSIIEDESYTELVNNYVMEYIKASCVNRLLYKTLNFKSYKILLNKLENINEPLVCLRNSSGLTLMRRFLAPVAFTSMRNKVKDRRTLG